MKNLILLVALLISTWNVQAQSREKYYVKHLEFPKGATIDQKVDMAARLVPTPQQLAWQQMELTAFLHFAGVNGGMVRRIPHSSILLNWMRNSGYGP